MANIPSAHAADTEYLVRRSMTLGYQWFSLLTPPIYVSLVLLRHGKARLNFNRFLRATWISGAVGCAAGGSFEYVRSAYSNEESIRSRRVRSAYNADTIRAVDHSTIGGILFAVLTPAVFWKRAHLAHLVLGGASLGSSVGLLTHYSRTLSGDPPPTTQIPNIQIAL